MDQQTFFKHMLREVNEKLPGGFSAHYRNVKKNNNVSYTGMYLSAFGEPVVSPLLYMEPVYEKYLSGETIESLAESIAGVLMKPREDLAEISSIMNPDYARAHIVYRLVGTRENEQFLKGTICRPFLDLSIVYAVYVTGTTIGSGMTQVTEEMADRWGFSEEELYRLATENTPRILPEKWLSLNEVAGTDESQAGGFYVLSNRESFYGTAALLYSESLRKKAAELEDDLMILPTSVHEAIIVPSKLHPVDVLENMFRELLRSEAHPEDLLSRSIYRLDHRTMTFSVVNPDE